jgi:hypothetical protein
VSKANPGISAFISELLDQEMPTADLLALIGGRPRASPPQ